MKPKNNTSLLIFLLVFSLYLFFLCPTIFTGDSPLLSTAAHALGNAHPPGYPLYVMLGKAMTFLPLGSIAYRLNLLSAISGALAAMLVYKSVRLLTDEEAPAMFAALLCATLPLAWSESTKAEVYTLNSALVMTVFYLGLKFLEGEPDRRLLLVASFVMGIGMGNHHTIGFMAFPVALLALMKARERGALLYSALFFAAGIGVYSFSYVMSVKFNANEALFSYSDSSSLRNLYLTFFRKGYGSSIDLVTAPAGDPLSFLRGGYNALRYLVLANMGALSLLPVFCIPLLWKEKARLSFVAVSVLSYVVVLPAMVYKFREPVARDLYLLDPYLLPALYILAVLSGCGAFCLIRAIGRRADFATRPLSTGLVLLPLALTLPGALKANDFSSYYLTEDYSLNMLDALPPRSIFISGSDSSYFPLAYGNFVEKRRDDVLLLFGDDEGIITQSSPPWSYKALFPDLPARGAFSRVEESYLMQGDVFAFEPISLPDAFIRRLKLTPYIQSFRLLPLERETDAGQSTAEFKRAFERFVYERNLKQRASDRYSTEHKMALFIPVSHFAYLMKTDGDLLLSSKYYTDAIRLVTPKGLVHYLVYLRLAGSDAEIRAFIEALEPYAAKDPQIRQLSTKLKEYFL